MNITFIVPPCFTHKQPAERTAGCTRAVYLAPNIYELNVAALLEKNGFNVAYRDFVYHPVTREKFDRFVSEDTSDAFCIWSVNLSIPDDLAAIAVIRKYHPEVPVVMMGPGPTYYSSKCLVDKNIFVCRGEPEETALELMSALSDNSRDFSDIKGLSYIDNEGKIVNNPPRPLIKDLDALPFPARHLIADQEYHNPKLKISPYTTMVTSRNCPYKCKYCVPSSLTFAREIEYRKANNNHKPIIGFRSVESIEKEVDMLAAQGVKAIGFMDDNFIWNEERTADICRIMKKHGIVWGCQARADAITEPIAKMLGESGCLYVDLGVESFNDDILKYINKGLTTAQIYNGIELLKKYNVPVKLNVLIGSSPLETKDTVRHTLREAKRLNVDQVMFNIVSPFPGTEYYKICKENGWIATKDYVPTDVQRESILNLPHLSAKEMEKLLFKNNLQFFLSWKFISKQMKRFSSPKEFISALKALKIKLFG